MHISSAIMVMWSFAPSDWVAGCRRLSTLALLNAGTQLNTPGPLTATAAYTTPPSCRTVSFPSTSTARCAACATQGSGGTDSFSTISPGGGPSEGTTAGATDPARRVGKRSVGQDQ